MKNKVKKIAKSWRFIFLVFLILASVFSVNYSPGAEGAAIRTVVPDSAADLAGMSNPDDSARPMDREVILAVDGEPIVDSDEYFLKIGEVGIESSYVIKTDAGVYELLAQPEIEYIELNETEEVIEQVFNETTNETVNVTTYVPKVIENITGVQPLGLAVYNAPSSNIRMGLDLQGGTRVIISPEDEITPEQFEFIKSNLEQRLNFFGLSDVSVNIVKDFQFNPEYIMIEIAGTTVEEIEQFVLSQGKFEAIVNGTPVFNGDDNDIVYVGKGPTESRVEQCGQADVGYVCRFSFDVRLSPAAAERMADVTATLDVIGDGDLQNSYLSAPIELFLDGKNVSSLNIGATLKGKSETQIRISGSGAAATEGEAIEAAKNEMKMLQTVIETGSLPTKLNIVKSDTISPILGQDFARNAMFVGFAALFTVAAVLLIRYRNLSIVVPMVIALVSEVLLVMGAYSMFNWTLDLAGIAGIIIVLGTGVDHLVVITDEAIKKSSETSESWKVRAKKAFGIVFGAFMTTAFAMLPLLIAGAGLLKGFAVTTLTGLIVGVLIVRPTYAKVIEILLR